MAQPTKNGGYGPLGPPCGALTSWSLCSPHGLLYIALTQQLDGSPISTHIVECSQPQYSTASHIKSCAEYLTPTALHSNLTKNIAHISPTCRHERLITHRFCPRINRFSVNAVINEVAYYVMHRLFNTNSAIFRCLFGEKSGQRITP